MTFHLITNGNPGVAGEVNDNFRHTNYGANLLPLNSSGVSSDDQLHLGSATAKWRDVKVSGRVFADHEKVALDYGSYGYFDNGEILQGWSEVVDTHGMHSTDGRLELLSSGLYLVNVSAYVPGGTVTLLKNRGTGLISVEDANSESIRFQYVGRFNRGDYLEIQVFNTELINNEGYPGHGQFYAVPGLFEASKWVSSV